MGLIILITLVIVINAFKLQAIDGKANLSLASNISQSQQIIRAPRGIIYDQQGRKLVSNDPTFNLYAIPNQVDIKNQTTMFTQLGQIFQIDANSLQEKFTKSGYNSAKQLVSDRVTLISNISYDKFLANYDKVNHLAGIYIISEAKRSYVNDPFYSHILGYVGDINLSELLATKLDPQARIGKDGIEKTFDAQLRGEDGLQVSQSSEQNSLQSWIPKSFKSGENVYLTIDSDWQKTLYQYLEKYTVEQKGLGSAGVIMEADTGKIKAMVSYPSYDLNSFANGISTKEFQGLLNNDATPLVNRAIAMQIPTGSVFKIFTGSGLLQENAITQSTMYKSGCFQLPGTGNNKICEADNAFYGTLNMIQALAHSSNAYFCQAALSLVSKYNNDQLAIQKLDSYYADFGFGKLTNIDLPGEQSGVVPSPEIKYKLLAQPWYLGDICNTAIGQGLFTATPLQVAVATAAIINGGKVYKPQIVDKFEDSDSNIQSGISSELVQQLPVSDNYLGQIREGMKAAVDYGTAFDLKNSPGNPIAKTGSSDATVKTNNGTIIKGAHSWVVGSFTWNNKKYVFTTAMEFGGRGYVSVPIMSNFISCLYNNFINCKN